MELIDKMLLDWILLCFLKIRAKNEYFKEINKQFRKISVKSLKNNQIKTGFRFIFKYFLSMSKELPKSSTLGSSLMIRFAAMVISIYKSIRKLGFIHQSSKNLTSKIAWIIYNDLTMLSWKLTRIISKDRMKRVAFLMKSYINIFPYKNPGYHMKILKTDPSQFKFNVYKCPPLELFRKFNLSDLCSISFCDLDYPLADNWRVNLNRTKTLVHENKLCNFEYNQKLEE